MCFCPAPRRRAPCAVRRACFRRLAARRTLTLVCKLPEQRSCESGKLLHGCVGQSQRDSGSHTSDTRMPSLWRASTAMLSYFNKKAVSRSPPNKCEGARTLVCEHGSRRRGSSRARIVASETSNGHNGTLVWGLTQRSPLGVRTPLHASMPRAPGRGKEPPNRARGAGASIWGSRARIRGVD